MQTPEHKKDIWLRKIVAYILNVYAPAFLDIKENPNITNGFRHLFRMTMNAKSFFRGDNDGWQIFLERIEFNSYFFNYEHLCLALLSDERKVKRKLGKKLIMDARQQGINGVRKMVKYDRSQMNLNAKDYSSFLKLDKIEIKSEPPPTKHLSEDQLEQVVNGTESIIKLCGLEDVHCHTQDCERAIPTTTLGTIQILRNHWTGWVGSENGQFF